MYNIKSLEKKEGSIVEITVEIESSVLESKWPKAIKELNESVKIDGFRPGHIPEKTLIEKVGEITILEEAAELAIEEVYPQIIKEKELKIIGNPKVVITKIARNSPLEVVIRVPVVPEIKLPDYMKIASKAMSKKDDSTEVTDKDVEAVMEELRAHRKQIEHDAKHHAGDGHDHSTHEKEEVLPIDDDFVKTLGDFKDVLDFKIKIKANLKSEKEYKAREKKRIETIETIRKDSTIEVPEVLIESELDRMTNEFSHQLSRMGRDFEEYKKDTNKTDETIREEWKDKAKERVQTELILLEIARIEKIAPKKEDVERESQKMEDQYPGTPKERIVAFIDEVLTKEEVFKFLETSK